MNTIDISEEDIDEINDIVFYPEDHKRAWEERDGIFYDNFPIHAVNAETKVITFGFLP